MINTWIVFTETPATFRALKPIPLGRKPVCQLGLSTNLNKFVIVNFLATLGTPPVFCAVD